MVVAVDDVHVAAEVGLFDRAEPGLGLITRRCDRAVRSDAGRSAAPRGPHLAVRDIPRERRRLQAVRAAAIQRRGRDATGRRVSRCRRSTCTLSTALRPITVDPSALIVRSIVLAAMRRSPAPPPSWTTAFSTRCRVLDGAAVRRVDQVDVAGGHACAPAAAPGVPVIRLFPRSAMF